MTDEGAREIASAIRYLAHAITVAAAPSPDAQGVSVSCLTEAVMGVTSALTACQGALSEIKELLETR